MRYLLIVSLVLCSICAFAQKKKVPSFVKPLPVPHRLVNDFSRFLSNNEKQWLEKELGSYNQRTGNAIVFVSLDSLTDPKTKKEYTIEEAAKLYFNVWGIGDSIKNNGVLLMVTRSPGRVRIEVGKGLETVLTNNGCQTIIDEKLVPNFKHGLFFTGIKEAVEAIEHTLDNPPAAQTASSAYMPKNDAANQNKEELSMAGGFVVLGFVLGLPALLFWWARKQARRFGGWFTGGGYNRYPRGHNHNSFNNYNNNYNNNSFFSGGGGGGSSNNRSSSSSSSSSSGSFGGGSSGGGGASGSW